MRRSSPLLLVLAMVVLPLIAADRLSAAGIRAPGDLVWDDVFVESAELDSWDCAAVGSGGSLYVAGSISRNDAGGSFMVARYAASGARLWLSPYGPDTGDDRVTDIAVDKSGNAYVVGIVETPAGDDMLVMKLSAAGVKRWEWRLGNVGTVDDSGAAVALDAAGNVYVAGTQTNPETGPDIMVTKLTSSGEQRYRYFYRGTRSDRGFDIVVDSAKRAYVVGFTQVGDADLDIVLVKLSAAGSRSWTRKIAGSAGGRDVPSGIVLAGGNVYLTGSVVQSGTATDVAVAKYSSGGTRRWLKTLDGSAHTDDQATSIVVDTAEAAYVAGSLTANAPPTGRGFLAKWDSAGRRKWVREVNTTPDTYGGVLYSVARGSNGTIYAAGSVAEAAGIPAGPATDADALVVAYSPPGIRKWLTTWNGDWRFGDAANRVVTGRTPSGTNLVYACGRSQRTAGFYTAAALAMRLRP